MFASRGDKTGRAQPSYRDQAKRLIAESRGDSSQALGLVILAREGGRGRNPAFDRISKVLSRAPDDIELRDLDHYLNAYEIAQSRSWRDYRIAQAMAAGYSALKWIDQSTGRTEFLRSVSAGRWRAGGPRTSQASWDEFLAGWNGAKDAYNDGGRP
jgi:hypothetical protein